MNVLSPPIWGILCRACEHQGRSRCLTGQLLRRDSMGAMTAVFVHGLPETPAVWPDNVMNEPNAPAARMIQP